MLFLNFLLLPSCFVRRSDGGIAFMGAASFYWQERPHMGAHDNQGFCKKASAATITETACNV